MMSRETINTVADDLCVLWSLLEIGRKIADDMSEELASPFNQTAANLRALLEVARQRIETGTDRLTEVSRDLEKRGM